MHADHIDIRKFKFKELNKKYSENKINKYVSGFAFVQLRYAN